MYVCRHICVHIFSNRCMCVYVYVYIYKCGSGISQDFFWDNYVPYINLKLQLLGPLRNF